jgi:2-haloacid dehalogenase
MTRYTTLLFDADGTLFDFNQSEHEALKQTLRAHALPFTAEIRSAYRDINQELWNTFEKGAISKEELQFERFQRLIDWIGQPAEARALNQTYVSELAQCSFIFEDALEIIRDLSLTHQLAIITNGIARVQYARFQKSELSSLISRVFISEEIGVPKPEKAFFEHVVSELKIENREHALVIGDSLSADIHGGINAGIDTCWYNPAHQPIDPSIQPTYEIDELDALRTIV